MNRNKSKPATVTIPFAEHERLISTLNKLELYAQALTFIADGEVRAADAPRYAANTLEH